MTKTNPGPDGGERCRWCVSSPMLLDYHDYEWGFPVGDDHILFEKLCLEGFQAGLSWRTILAKRDYFRTAFCNFDFSRVACFNNSDVERLLRDTGIVRHRGKIEAVVNNAKRACELVEQQDSLATFIWSFEPENPAKAQSVSTSPESTALSKELKKRGWRYVGPTTVFAFMQAMGLVNDHSEDCIIRNEVERVRNGFKRPSR